MKLAAIVGILCGLACALSNRAVGALLSYHPFLKGLGEAGWALPLVIAAAVLGLNALMAAGFSPKAWEELFESYYLGAVGSGSRVWVLRGMGTFLASVTLSIFDTLGSLIEIGFTFFSKAAKHWRFYYEDRQILIVSLFAGVLSTGFESPFFGALFAIELFASNNARVRAATIVSALFGFASALLFQGRLFSEGYQSPSFRMELFSALLSSQHSLEAGVPELAKLTFWSAISGAAACTLSWLLTRGLFWASKTFDHFFSSGLLLRIGLTGLLIAILYLTTFGDEFSLETAAGHHLWENLAWMRLSIPSAAVLLMLHMSRFVLATSGWGSLGLLIPVLSIGALEGFLLSSLAHSSWLVPLVAGGATAMAGAFFGTPLAMSALLLEASRDVRLWWVGSVAILSAAGLARLCKMSSFPACVLSELGLEVFGGRVVSLLRGIPVSTLMTREVQTLHKQASVQELRQAISQSPYNVLAVTSAEGKYAGVLSVEYIPHSLRSSLHLGASPKTVEALDSILEIKDLIDSEAPVVSPSEDVVGVIPKFSHHPFLAVVDENGYLCGVLFESAVHARYRRELASSGFRLSS